ncbi:MAG: PAS domain S-box protein [Opitutaceae bacterium]|nr:PAS domain S-box protein [Opitutaceae bacterium]
MLTACIFAWSAGGIRAPATLTFIPLVFLAGLLLGFRTGLLAGLLAGGWALAMAVAEIAGHLPPPTVQHTPLSIAITLLLGLGIVTLAQHLTAEEVARARAEAESASAARRRTEDALSESEQRLALALDAATDGIFDVDLTTGEAYCSPRYFTMLGYAPDEFAPTLTAWEAMLHPEDLATAANAMGRYRDGHTDSHHIETRMRTKDGAWRWILSRGRVAARDTSGAPLRLIGTHVDIHERKQAELALHRAKDFAESLIANANALIIGLDPAGRVILFNTTAETVSGYTRAELVGRSWFETLVPRAQYPLVWAEFGRLQSNSLSEHFENPIRTKTGEERHIVWRNNVLREAGRITGTISFGIDVTDQRHAEQALAKERDLVSRLVETSPSGILFIDAAGQIIFANTEADRLLALRRDTATPASFAQPEWRTSTLDGHPVPENERPFRRVLATGRPLHGVRYALDWPDGRHVIVSISTAPLFDHAGKLEGVVTTIADITERQRADDALRENEERLRSIVDHAPFGAHLYQLRPDNRLILQAANQSADTILHIEHRALFGREILEAFPGLSGSDIPETYRQVVLTGQPHHRAQVLYDEGTISGAFDVHALPIGLQRVVVFFADITERQRAEAALRRSEERFRQLFNSGNDAVFVHALRPDGVPDSFSQVNDIACQLLGYSREELLTRCPHDINAPTLADRAGEVVARLQRDHHALFEMELLTRDGRLVPAEINARVFELDGQPTVLSVVRDCSERKRLEEQLRQAQKMEVFGQLAGGVAHDFNNLLVAIIGNAELLLDGSLLSGHPRDQVEQIHSAGRRAAALTHQLLLFSRKQQPQRVPADLSAIVTNHVKLLRRIIGEDINLTVELAPGPLPVLADGNMIEQVAMNLVVNARDAMPRGGSLTLTTRRTTLDAVAAARAACSPGEYVSLVVRDTGAGIPPEIRSRIFEPFFTTKPAGKGTGLGLATVLGIVQQHQGGITLASEAGRGTEFTIHLPLASGAAAAPVAVGPTASTAAAPATVLVVEDDDAVRAIVEHTLRRRHYRVHTASSVAEGLVHLERAEPRIDLVLSDVVMPGGIGGPQLAEQVAIRWPSVPVLLMSGYARELEDTGTPILQKPFSTTQLLAFVQEGLARRPNIPPPRGE